MLGPSAGPLRLFEIAAFSCLVSVKEIVEDIAALGFVCSSSKRSVLENHSQSLRADSQETHGSSSTQHPSSSAAVALSRVRLLLPSSILLSSPGSTSILYTGRTVVVGLKGPLICTS